MNRKQFVPFENGNRIIFADCSSALFDLFKRKGWTKVSLDHVGGWFRFRKEWFLVWKYLLKLQWKIKKKKNKLLSFERYFELLSSINYWLFEAIILKISLVNFNFRRRLNCVFLKIDNFRNTCLLKRIKTVTRVFENEQGRKSAILKENHHWNFVFLKINKAWNVCFENGQGQTFPCF